MDDIRLKPCMASLAHLHRPLKGRALERAYLGSGITGSLSKLKRLPWKKSFDSISTYAHIVCVFLLLRIYIYITPAAPFPKNTTPAFGLLDLGLRHWPRIWGFTLPNMTGWMRLRHGCCCCHFAAASSSHHRPTALTKSIRHALSTVARGLYTVSRKIQDT